MTKIKRYIDCYVPVTTCNLRCTYCYITQTKAFANELPKFPYSPEHMGQAFSQRRWGGPCVITLCGGGETLLPPEMPAIIKALLEQGHVVMVVTNGLVTPRFKELAAFPKALLERLFFKFSFHYLELLRTSQLDVFFDNIKKMHRAGASFTLEITPHDELIPHIEAIKKISMEKAGAWPHITVARNNKFTELPILTELSKGDYQKVWGQFGSKLFDYKYSIFNVKRREFCYAGDWTTTMDLASGDLRSCYMGDIFYNIYANIDENIPFQAIGCNCRESHCYNGHSFLSFGTIPSLRAPGYLEMRNRVCADDKEWLSPVIKGFFSSKLIESNAPYSFIKKVKCNIKHSDNSLIKRAVQMYLKIKNP